MAVRWLDQVVLNGLIVNLAKFETVPHYIDTGSLRGEYLYEDAFDEFTNLIVQGDVLFNVSQLSESNWYFENEDYLSYSWFDSSASVYQEFYYNFLSNSYGRWSTSPVFYHDARLAIAVDDEHQLGYIMLIGRNSADTENVLWKISELNTQATNYIQNRMYLGAESSIPEPPTPSDPDEFYFYNHSKKVNSTKQPTGGTKIEGHFSGRHYIVCCRR